MPYCRRTSKSKSKKLLVLSKAYCFLFFKQILKGEKIVCYLILKEMIDTFLQYIIEF